MKSNKMIIAGGSGFLGQILSKWFAERGFEVVILSRSARQFANARCVEWDGKSLGPWAEELDGAHALINLAGRTVNCRYTKRNRAEILDSRIASTKALSQAVADCKVPPSVWLNSSTATIYKHTFDTAYGEDGEVAATPAAKDAFSIEVGEKWEAEFYGVECPATRKGVLRAAMVLATVPGTVYEVLRRLARFGLAGRMGGGKQYLSWIHADDFCRSVGRLVEDAAASGIYNIAAPTPVTNAHAMRLFREAVRMPIGLPATRWMLEIGALVMRTETELIIKSRRVVPTRLLAEGFEFNHPTIESAIANLECKRSERS